MQCQVLIGQCSLAFPDVKLSIMNLRPLLTFNPCGVMQGGSTAHVITRMLLCVFLLYNFITSRIESRLDTRKDSHQ